MIEFKEHTLENGLKVILHRDTSTPLVAVNILYKVGSKHEHPDRTGFAHLFEHLMFSGSKHVKDFDIPIQQAGGENNAFTNSDSTNFYDIVPKENIETVLWLESDRMKSLNINQKSLRVQKNVVVEEFKEVCLNQPYGTLWHHLNQLAYKVHPYQWPTIGRTFKHIEDANLDDVQQFYDKHYRPSNAILSIAGNIDYDETLEKVREWFGQIPNQDVQLPELPKEPIQKEFRYLEVLEEVPAEAIYLAFHMEARKSEGYYLADLLSDILGNGRSSRFHKELYKNAGIFNTIDAYITGSMEPGLFVIESKLKPGVKADYARELIWNELHKLMNTKIDELEFQKLINKLESAYSYGEINVLHKALNLAFFAHLGDAKEINYQVERYQKIDPSELQAYAKKLFRRDNCSEVHYKKASENL